VVTPEEQFLKAGSWRDTEAESTQRAKPEPARRDTTFAAWWGYHGGAEDWARSEYANLRQRERERRERAEVFPSRPSRWAFMRATIR
jgi:hypothetical protein